MTEEQEKYLQGFGHSPDRVKSIAEIVEKLNKKGEASGKRNKEVQEPTQTESTPETQPVAEKKEAAPETQPVAENKETTPETQPVAENKDSVGDVAFKEMAEAFISTMRDMATEVTALKAQVSGIQEKLDSVSTEVNTKAKQIVAETPQLSVKELIRQAVWGDDSAQIDGRSKLANDGPKESKEKDEVTPSVTGIRFLDQAIAANLQPQ